jgi:hypothetical protein
MTEFLKYLNSNIRYLPPIFAILLVLLYLMKWHVQICQKKIILSWRWKVPETALLDFYSSNLQEHANHGNDLVHFKNILEQPKKFKIRRNFWNYEKISLAVQECSWNVQHFHGSHVLGDLKNKSLTMSAFFNQKVSV